jgi:hypothetical protein
MSRKQGRGRKKKRRGNRGSFAKGPDPRRHVFSQEERQRGYANARARLGQGDVSLFAWLWRKVRSYYRARGTWLGGLDGDPEESQ